MRHSERLDQVLRNRHWPSEVFINGVYSPNMNLLPTVLPIRTNPNEYLLDTPLTKYGYAHAYHTGEFFGSLGIIPDRIYTSPAMRCIQTANSVLDGLGVREIRPLKIELALHESTRKQLPLQSDYYFSSVGFNIDLDYDSLFLSNDSRIILNESRLDYYRRMHLILKRIIQELTEQSIDMLVSPTILIVTHQSCVTLLGTMLNLDCIDDKLSYLNEIESNKRHEVHFLSMIIAEYDILKGLWTFLSDFPQIQQSNEQQQQQQ